MNNRVSVALVIDISIVHVNNLNFFLFYFSQTEISKRLSALINQLVPFLSAEHQQQVLTAVERAKQITMSELNAVIGVSMI